MRGETGLDDYLGTDNGREEYGTDGFIYRAWYSPVGTVNEHG